MPPTAPIPDRVSFAGFDFDIRALELRKRGIRVKVQGQPLEILALLLERPGELVTREELQQRLWPGDTFVDFEQSLNAAIKRLRVALDDSAEQPRYVETLARRGYRFIGSLKESEASAAEGSAARASPLGRRVAALVLAAIVLFAGGYTAWRLKQPAQSVEAKRVMLAVLPFENLSRDPEEEFFSDGLTEEMITQLGGLEPQKLGVIARASAMQYKRSTKSAAQIGRELGVDYLLEGSTRRAEGRVRITAQLIQVRDQTHVWAESFEGDPRDILRLQQEVAAAVAREIQLKLTPQQQARLGSARQVDPGAHEAYLKGLYFWNKFTVDGFLKSQQYFQQAIDKDPQYAPAYAGLAASYALQGNFSVLPPGEAYLKSKAAAAKAIELDETVSFAHSQLGFVTMFYDRDWAGAEREFKRAIEINPSNANAYEGYAFYFVVRGKLDRAQEEIQSAREIDPLSLIVSTDVAFISVFARKYDLALAQLQRTLEMDPGFPPAYWILSYAHEFKGQFKEANAENLRGTSLANRYDSKWVEAIQKAYDTSGWKGAWQKRLELMLAAQAKGQSIPPFWLAMTYVHLGEKQKALDFLEKAVEERFYLVVFLREDPRFDSLRGEPRFQALLQRIGI